jgi:hypothetical protein
VNDLAVPISGVDALHAHFAEWVKFLDAKGLELEAQLAKLEARKERAAASATAPSTQVGVQGSGYLELAFGDQAIPSKPEDAPVAVDAEPALRAENVLPEARACAENAGQDAREANKTPQAENRASGKTPDLVNTETLVPPAEESIV